ncbi:uncharacterized protein UHOD_02741 [Ustilago sp. UG-2017b]|nr:uncharacterized protein UHOD_02741 [Ustilago sp. UG-2017b]
MTRNERNSEAGPSNTASPFSWTMSLFGGRSSKTPSASNRNNATSSSGLGSGRPTSTTYCNREERESLIPQSGGDDFDDSDAISLLSNIADRDSRRGGSSAAARRRARARSRAQGRTCGTLFFDLEDWGRAMSCGLLGRNGKNDDAGGAGRQRAASIGSVLSRGARRNNQPANSSAIHATSRHSRSVSDASTDSAGSLLGSGFDIDADAGMLDDQAIARFGQPSSDAEAEAEAAAAKAKTEAKAKAREEEEAKARAERQKAINAEARRLQQETEAESQRQKEEEARLAAEEEAAIAKARRKAERKAAKAGLFKLQQETQTAQRWRTEAEAEAAAGGFGLADVEGEEQYAEEFEQAEFRYEEGQHGAKYDQYGDAEEGAEGEGYYATVEEHGPGGVVHHHHYYHAPSRPAEEQYGFLSPNPLIETSTQAAPEEDTHADKTVSEDEADIAGLSFGRKKLKSRNKDGSAGSRSGGGLTARTFPHTTTGGSSSGGSASGHRVPTSASSSAGRPNYRDKPRRHERTSSKSSNSSSGIFSYQSSNTLYHHALPSTAATSVISPLGLPNLYESEPIYSKTSKDGDGREERGEAVEGLADPNASEFGVMTAAGNAVTNKAGAKRVKKSYRDKRTKSQVMGDGDEQGGEDKFEGFPGF